MFLSFVVPAHNEAALIEATVRAIHASAQSVGASYEIIVVDDSSTDKTGALAERASARLVRVHRRQIAAARNAGARASSGDVLVFVDADTLVNGAVLRAMMRALRSGAVGGGSRIALDKPVPFHAPLGLFIVQSINQLAGIMPGCFLFCTRTAFEAAGGYDEQFYAGEEVFLSRALRRLGRMVIVKPSVVTSGRKLRAYSGWEILFTFLNLGIRGPGSVKDRRHLDLWYARREDSKRRL